MIKEGAEYASVLKRRLKDLGYAGKQDPTFDVGGFDLGQQGLFKYLGKFKAYWG